MCVRNRYHGGVLDDGGSAHGGHRAPTHHALPLPGRDRFQGSVRQLSQGRQSVEDIF